MKATVNFLVVSKADEFFEPVPPQEIYDWGSIAPGSEPLIERKFHQIFLKIFDRTAESGRIKVILRTKNYEDSSLDFDLFNSSIADYVNFFPRIKDAIESIQDKEWREL